MPVSGSNKPIPKVPSTFYNITQLLSRSAVSSGVPVCASTIACLPLANANLDSDEARVFHCLKPRMDPSTKSGVTKQTMLQSMHFFAQVAQTAARKCIATKAKADVRCFAECVVRKWETGAAAVVPAEAGAGASGADTEDEAMRDLERDFQMIDAVNGDALSEEDQRRQLHGLLHQNCMEEDNCLGWRLWLVNSPEASDKRPGNTTTTAIQTVLNNIDKAHMPGSKVESEWGEHDSIQSEKDAYRACRSSTGLTIRKTPAEISASLLWPYLGACDFHYEDCTPEQRQVGFSYVVSKASAGDGRRKDYFLHWPHAGSVFEVEIRSDITPAALSLTPFPDKYFKSLRKRRRDPEAASASTARRRLVHPSQNLQAILTDCPPVADQLCMQLSETAGVRDEQLREALQMPQDLDMLQDSLKVQPSSETFDMGLDINNMDSHKEFVMEPRDDPSILAAAINDYVPLTNVFPSTQDSTYTVPATMKMINADRKERWFQTMPPVPIYSPRGEPLSLWGHFVRHQRFHLDILEQFVSNHSEFLLLMVQSIDSFRCQTSDLRLNVLFDGDKATGKSFIAKLFAKHCSYGVEIKNRSTTAALIGGQQECHRLVIFDETPSFLEHDKSTDINQKQNFSSIKSFLTDQLVVENRAHYQPKSDNEKNGRKANGLVTITGRNIVIFNLSVMQVSGSGCPARHA